MLGIFQENPDTTCRLEFPLSVLLVSKLTVEMTKLPPQNLILISVFYQILLFIGYTILLGGLKLGYEVLDLLGREAIFFGHGVD